MTDTTLPEHLQTGAVQHQVRQDKCRVIRHRQPEARQASTLWLKASVWRRAKWKTDRRVSTSSIASRSSAVARPARCLPTGKGRLIKPERQVATAPQPGLAGRSVHHASALLRDAVTAGGIVSAW